MSNDRGTIKWISLMLPEHVKLLKEMWQEDHKTARPVLDSQQIEMLNGQILEAFKSQAAVTLSYYSNGEIFNQNGIITVLDSDANNLTLWTISDTKLTIPFHDIIAVSI
ncbi:YolD-like family protein [Virgibacillus doumboii]|uniref:YolD-like family protein n=1 Tax=Virgibacillus doumboii TaxID=2697503 RepID=UPI0013DEBB26|nr:YolD-like family protein [Virgibacillus doumboii]